MAYPWPLAPFDRAHPVRAHFNDPRISGKTKASHVAAPWLHVHFAERRANVYRNPLRAAGLTPWRDTTRPKVTSVKFLRNGRELRADLLSGPVDVVAEAYTTRRR